MILGLHRQDRNFPIAMDTYIMDRRNQEQEEKLITNQDVRTSVEIRLTMIIDWTTIVRPGKSVVINIMDRTVAGVNVKPTSKTSIKKIVE